MRFADPSQTVPATSDLGADTDFFQILSCFPGTGDQGVSKWRMVAFCWSRCAELHYIQFEAKHEAQREQSRSPKRQELGKSQRQLSRAVEGNGERILGQPLDAIEVDHAGRKAHPQVFVKGIRLVSVFLKRERVVCCWGV